MRTLREADLGQNPDPAAAPTTGRPAAPARPALFIVWTGFQRRVASMGQVIDFDVRYYPPPFASKWLKPLGYLVQAARTAGALLSRRPAEVWIQTPPTFVPYVVLALRPFAGRYRIVVDGHNSSFVPNWSRFPGAVWVMNRSDVVLVHNDEFLPVAIALGVNPGKIRVLEDPPPTLDLVAAPAETGAPPTVLVPCSFAADEPIPTLLAAARLLPEARFFITGSRRKAEALGFVEGAPDNVTFTDYLPLEDFERLLGGASVVLGLTDVEGIQLSVANEALGAHRALVLSDTRILRTMFGDAALFAPNTPEGLSGGLRDALARGPELEARSAALKTQRQRDWRDAVAAVTAPQD